MLKENLEKIFEEIKNGNNLGEPITLVGATKTVPVEIINESISLGLSAVAENKVSEFRNKTEFINGAKQHFIGHLQTNKIKYVVGKVELIHSIDSYRLAQIVSERAIKINAIQNILVQINIGSEEQKSGLDTENAIKNVKEISKLHGIKVCGIMAMLPKTDDTSLLKTLCLKMRSFYNELKADGLEMKYLSLGMSEDYKIAIKNGSNMIRLGSAIFGKRN